MLALGAARKVQMLGGQNGLLDTSLTSSQILLRWAGRPRLLVTFRYRLPTVSDGAAPAKRSAHLPMNTAPTEFAGCPQAPYAGATPVDTDQWKAMTMDVRDGDESSKLLAQLASLRQHQHNGHRSPHKPLLVLLALGRLTVTGSSELPWSVAEVALADLIAEFGQPSRTGRAQSAAYPFTRLRADGVWVLDADVEMDLVRPLTEHHVTGRLVSPLEAAFRGDPALIRSVARDLVASNFPDTVAPDVLEAVGLDPAWVLGAADALPDAGRMTAKRLRDPSWRSAVLQAWDRQCAFCGYDGQLAGASIGVEAAHVRWFAFDGPDTFDNGLALCVLHHKLFDIGVLGLDSELRILVSIAFTARTNAGRAVYDLHHRSLSPRPGTPAPAPAHIAWHAREVFKAQPLTSSLPRPARMP